MKLFTVEENTHKLLNLSKIGDISTPAWWIIFMNMKEIQSTKNVVVKISSSWITCSIFQCSFNLVSSNKLFEIAFSFSIKVFEILKWQIIITAIGIMYTITDYTSVFRCCWIRWYIWFHHLLSTVCLHMSELTVWQVQTTKQQLV